MSLFYCKKKKVKVNKFKVYAVCLLRGCPFLKTVRDEKQIKKLKKMNVKRIKK